MMNGLFANSGSGVKLEAVLHFDGSCWPNPGPDSRCGFILQVRSGKRIERSIELGDGTNNTAEYNGLIHGLEAALAEGVTDIEVYGDSQLVIYGVRRMKGTRKGKPHLELLKARAIELARKFNSIDWNWVPRSENAEADALT